MTKGLGAGVVAHSSQKEGLNGPPEALVAGVVSVVIPLSSRPTEFGARDDKGGVAFSLGLVAGIPGLKSETWGTLRLHPSICGGFRGFDGVVGFDF
jgi:hypothetical protein